MFHVGPAALAPSPVHAEPTAARVLIERQLAALSELAEIGMEIARAAGRAATGRAAEAAAGDAFPGDPGLAYTRVARAVRLTFALQAQLLKDLAALDKAESLEAIHQRTRRRLRAERLVDEAIVAERPEAETWEFSQVSKFARERLRDADEQADLLGRPFGEIVARICADLGFSPERTQAVVAGVIPREPSPSGLSRGSMVPRQADPGSWVERPVPRDEPEKDGGGDDGEGEGAVLEWPPPA